MRLSVHDQIRVASIGVRARKVRAGLSGLGIAIGVAAIVAVLGLSSSSQAGLLTQIDRLGTNLLTASSGQTFAGAAAELPAEGPARGGPPDAGPAGAPPAANGDAKASRTPLIPAISTNALTVRAASLNLPAVAATGI